MMLKIKLIQGKGAGNTIQRWEINSDDFNQIALVLDDLKKFNLPIDKAIKKLSLKKSDWDASLGI
jgi:hypothetical protein